MKESEKRAQLKYAKSLKQINIRFYPGEEDLYQFVRGLSAKQRKDIFRREKDSNSPNN